MASADVEKLAVFDGRIVQQKPRFAVEKGSLSVTNQPFSALSQSTSQHTYSVQVPSEQTFVDRKVDWTSQVGLQITFASVGNAVAGTYTIPPMGKSWSYCAFPLQSLTSTIQATINDTSVVVNSADVLKEVLRLVDFSADRIQRTTPTKLDVLADCRADAWMPDSVYGSFVGANIATAGSLAYSTGISVRDEFPNGAFISGLTDAGYVTPYVTSFNGAIPTATSLLTAGNSAASTNITTATLNVDGSISITASATITAPWSLTVYVSPFFTEKLVLSPFVFSDVREADTGLFGIQNIQFVLNMRQPSDCRLVRQLIGYTTDAAPVAFNISSAYSTAAGVPSFQKSRLDMTFLTPSLDLPLPPKSVVPFQEFPRYITSQVSLATGINTAVATQTITLPQIPDMLVVYAKPTSYADNTQADWYFPITGCNIQWDNFAGLMSTYTQPELYEISVKNGLEMTYPVWSGRVNGGGVNKSDVATTSNASYINKSVLQTVGGPLLIKPGQDYALQTGQAPSLVGNYTLQISLNLANYTGAATTANIYVMTINSGFFESVKGTSRVVKGILNEAEIISAPIAGPVVRGQIERVSGGVGVFKKLGHFLSKAPSFIHSVKEHIKPVAAMIKPHLATHHQSALSSVGLGEGEGEGHYPSHSGGKKHAKKSVLRRLM
jgi:hypothetical protein